ncbi:MAG: hypothetical protein AUJ51_04865 [Elusimicrobia bacterium CG1_02_56_21]|nr:MAG: hypothetical protein AUJ51_04865 [Elusimicrobia bacterium CG1_02_56_21]
MNKTIAKKLNISGIRTKYFPLKTKEGFCIRPSDAKEVYDFLGKAYNKVFPPGDDCLCFRVSPERRQQMAPLRKLYSVIHHEWFLFLNPKGQPIGWHMGEAEDHQTFYMWNSGILPEYQNRGLFTAFSETFMRYLRELGYERISSHHKPTNRRILILKLKQGFDISGFEMTENWGALVKLIKILPRDRREAFYKMFGEASHLDERAPRG